MAKAHRAAFLKLLGGDVAVLGAAPVAVRSNDTEFDYRPDNDLVYLTAFAEPDAVAVFAPAHPEHRFVLFVRPRDPERERWDGSRAGVEGAKAVYGADAAFPIAELAQRLPDLLAAGGRLHCRLGRNAAFDDALLAGFRAGIAKRPRTAKGPTEIVDLGRTLHELRFRKSNDELALLRRACEITAQGHLAAMRAARPGVFEYELAALLEYTYRRLGAEGSGYSPIVAAGANATVLHYRRNRDALTAGQLLLIDSGAEFDFITADVTRTFSIDGTMTKAQRRIYDLVLDAQLAAIDAVRPGRPFGAAHNAAVEVLARGLITLKIIDGPLDLAIAEGRYKKFYMHRTGHWLGMDVHDVGQYGEGDGRALEPGAVVTVEPGLYFPPEEDGVPDEYRGIGVRIEDDVLVTARGHEVVTSAIPKTPAELRRVRARAS
jgi:Xaa-Pro aminopeptidase